VGAENSPQGGEGRGRKGREGKGRKGRQILRQKFTYCTNCTNLPNDVEI